MFCTNCGSQFEDGNAFCPNCGTKVETVAQPVAAPAPAAVGAVPQIFTVSRRMTAPACPATEE